MLGKKYLMIAYLLLISFILFITYTHTRAEDSNRTLFRVNNLSCGVCVGKIDAKLKSFDGYIRLLANTDQGLVAIDHQQNLTDSKISEAITSLGYPTKVAAESEFDQYSSVSSESPGWRSPSDNLFNWILKIFSR